MSQSHVDIQAVLTRKDTNILSMCFKCFHHSLRGKSLQQWLQQGHKGYSAFRDNTTSNPTFNQLHVKFCNMNVVYVKAQTSSSLSKKETGLSLGHLKEATAEHVFCLQMCSSQL